MIYCEVLLSISTRGRELKKFLKSLFICGSMSISTRGRELKNIRSLKTYRAGCRSPREVVSWKILSITPWVNQSSRSPREVVSWKFLSRFCSVQCNVDLHERSWVEKICWTFSAEALSSISTRGRELKRHLPKALVLLFCRSPREVVSWKNFCFLQWNNTVVDLHERSWVEKLLLQVFPQGHPVDLHERSWVEKSPLIKWYWLIRVDLHERSWVEKSYSQKIEQRF